MTQSIKIDTSSFDGCLQAEETKKKGAKALAASLYRIEDLLQSVTQKTPEVNDGSYIEAMAEASLQDPKQAAARAAFLQFSEDVKKAGAENIERVIRQSVLPALKKVIDRSSAPLADTQNQKSSTPTSKDGGLSTALLFLQEFQTAVAQQQVNQNNELAKVGAQSVQVAQDQLNDVCVQIQKAVEAAAKAAEQPSWMIALQVFAVVGGAALAAVTGGVGAMAIALVIGGIMASPASTMIATAIATDIVNAQGKATNETAAEKQQAIANIVGKIVVAVMFVIFSMGTSLCTSALTTATTVAEEAGETAGADAANSVGSKLSSGWGAAWRTGVSEGLSSIASSNMILDVLVASDSKFAKGKGGTAVDVILNLITAVLAAYSGFKAVGMTAKGADLVDKFGTAGRALTVGAHVPQIAQNAVQLGFAIKKAEYLSTEAEYTRKLATSQANLQMTLASIDTLSDAGTKLNNNGSSIIEGVTEQMDQMANVAGGAANAVNQVLASG